MLTTEQYAPALSIDGNTLTLEEIEQVALNYRPVHLAEDSLQKIRQSRKTVEDSLAHGKAIYGITTGFGKFKDVTIKAEDSARLQHNLILSHAAGVGPLLPAPIVRAALLLRANALAKGYSGVREELITLLIACLNKNIHPCIPEQGSLGASGDLAPLSHLSLVLIGEGSADCAGEILPGRLALQKAGLSPLKLSAKEGLALTNGTQIMSAMGTLTLLQGERLAKQSDIIGAISLEALTGTDRAFAEVLHQVRPHPGQMQSAHNLRRLLAGSTIMESHRDCGAVQDAYSLRCMPQVHGASRAAFEHIRHILSIEVNSATDNPLIFENDIIFGGNFHGQPLALALDYMGIAAAELANISERRTERLVNPFLSNGLPAFLTLNGGLNSGMMIAQYTAASLVSENKVLAHPASVDSIPTSANQEDHVSMGATAGRKAMRIMDNVKRALAIELLCACQALELRMRHCAATTGPVQSSAAIMSAFQAVRQHIPFMEEDRELHLDIAKAENIISSDILIKAVEDQLGPLH